MVAMVEDKMPDPNVDSCELYSRRTRSGRRLHYLLSVVQQPERARACGSGPKSSADRRPVDPPPVVQLRIYEGERYDETAKDITFNYNANFFLFATLEHARVIAHGRVQTEAANTPPVLTGLPVSGMAYLDRPNMAGYFLFPDLSVRHEGRYRLSFNLYEETKEDRDKDDVPPTGDPFPEGSFDFRMELKSHDFTVFSAKKFPGLAESTDMSRMVAEQGCRVRIRRDVRMRRREPKSSGNGGDDKGPSGEDEFGRRRHTRTPESSKQPELNGSADGAPYGVEQQRRSSGAEYQSTAPPPPGFPSSQVSTTAHLMFGHGHHFGNPPQYPQSSSGHASPVPRSPTYPNAQAGCAHPHPNSAGAPLTPRAPTPSHSDRSKPHQHAGYAAHPSPRRDSFASDSRRMSGVSIAPRPITPQSARERDSFLGKLPYAQPLAPAPPKVDTETPIGGPRPLLPCFRSGLSDLGSRNTTLPPLPSPSSDRDSRSSIKMEQGAGQLTPLLAQPPKQLESRLQPAPASPNRRKRSHAAANAYFGSLPPSAASKDHQRHDETFEAPVQSNVLQYQRADGRRATTMPYFMCEGLPPADIIRKRIREQQQALKEWQPPPPPPTPPQRTLDAAAD